MVQKSHSAAVLPRELSPEVAWLTSNLLLTYVLLLAEESSGKKWYDGTMVVFVLLLGLN